MIFSTIELNETEQPESGKTSKVSTLMDAKARHEPELHVHLKNMVNLISHFCRTTFSNFELKSDHNSKTSNPKYSQHTPSSCNAQKVTVCSALRRISVGHGGRARVRPIVETVSHEMPAEFKRLDPIDATPRTSFEESGMKGSADSRRSGPSPQMASGSLATRLIFEFFTNTTVA